MMEVATERVMKKESVGHICPHLICCLFLFLSCCPQLLEAATPESFGRSELDRAIAERGLIEKVKG